MLPFPEVPLTLYLSSMSVEGWVKKIPPKIQNLLIVAIFVLAYLNRIVQGM